MLISEDHLPLPRGFDLSNQKRAPVLLLDLQGDDILPSYVGIILTNHYPVIKPPVFIMESIREVQVFAQQNGSAANLGLLIISGLNLVLVWGISILPDDTVDG